MSSDIQKADRLALINKSFWQEFSQLAAQYEVVNLGLGFPNFAAPMFLRQAAADALLEKDLNQYTRSAVSE